MARPQGWGWFVLRYMGMVAQFCSDDSHFSDFQSDWLPILYLNTVRLTHSFCRKKIGISLSHLVPEIPVPKDGLLFHQDGLFGRFKTFRINFPLPFLYYWPPFSLILNLFELSFLQNRRSDWVHFFHVLNPATENLVKYPTPLENTPSSGFGEIWLFPHNHLRSVCKFVYVCISHTASTLCVTHSTLRFWPYYMIWAHSITTPCTCVNSTSCNQLKIIPEPEIQAPRGKEW